MSAMTSPRYWVACRKFLRSDMSACSWASYVAVCTWWADAKRFANKFGVLAAADDSGNIAGAGRVLGEEHLLALKMAAAVSERRKCFSGR